MKDDYKTYGLDDILSSIKKAKENEDIKGIYIQATSLGAIPAAAAAAPAASFFVCLFIQISSYVLIYICYFYLVSV